MQQDYFEDVFTYPVQEFKDHFDKRENQRILFSGKYGMGKTSFIKAFFKTNEENLNHQQYDVYHLFPVNYSIASNEDIIDYIKYDIIYEMLKKGISFPATHLEKYYTLPFFAFNNFDKIIVNLLSGLPKIGKPIEDISKKLKELYNEYIKWHKEANKNEGDKLLALMTTFESKPGSLYENDIVTKIIADNIRTKSTNHAILVIDDMDRLDPDHVFRIMNVFAAQFDTLNNNTNKFGFDKLMLVCDYHNIRHLFSHKFGANVDFSGYADKFYSTDVYFFDNKEAILNIIQVLLNQMVMKYKNNRETEELVDLFPRANFLHEFLLIFLKDGLISLRKIIRLRNLEVKYYYDQLVFKEGKKVRAGSVTLAVYLKILKEVVGDAQTLLTYFEVCKSRKNHFDGFEIVFRQAIYILTGDDHDFVSEKSFPFTFNGNFFYMNPKIRDRKSLPGGDIFERKVINGLPSESNGETYIPSLQTFWLAIQETTKKLIAINYIK